MSTKSRVNFLKKIIFTGFFVVGASLKWVSASAYALSNELCHPSVNTHMPQYIVGYGSLIQIQSKNKTWYNTANNNLPVMVQGYQRGWFAKGNPIGFSATFLGVVREEKSQFNGVIFRLPSTAVRYYDAREQSYCREAISPDRLAMLNHHALPDGQFWIYLTPPQNRALPSVNYPIVQSYVDIFLSGCLSIEKQYHLKNFACQCIDTTQGWSSPWVNDRIYPRRPFEHQPAAKQIDALLFEKIPKVFKEIQIE